MLSASEITRPGKSGVNSVSRGLLMAVLFLCCAASQACILFAPNYRKALTHANETTAILNLKKIAQLQQIYSLDHRGSFGTFKQLVDDGYLDGRYISDNHKVNEYLFTMAITQKGAGSPKDSFTINADPDGSIANARHFYVDANGQLHTNASQSATANDPLINDSDFKQLTEETPRPRD